MASELGLVEEIQEISDFKIIAQYGVMSTPALVINEKVIFSGRCPSKNEIKKLMQKYL